jgi:chromosome segregation ATPase
LISGWAGALQQELIWPDREWERMGKLLNCFPNSIITGVMKLVQEKEGLAGQIQELEEKKFSLEKDCREAEHDIAYLKSEVRLLGQQVNSIKRERDELQDLSRR